MFNFWDDVKVSSTVKINMPFPKPQPPIPEFNNIAAINVSTGGTVSEGSKKKTEEQNILAVAKEIAEEKALFKSFMPELKELRSMSTNTQSSKS